MREKRIIRRWCRKKRSAWWGELNRYVLSHTHIHSSAPTCIHPRSPCRRFNNKLMKIMMNSRPKEEEGRNTIAGSYYLKCILEEAKKRRK